MKKILTQCGVCALAVALMMPLAQAQPAGVPAASGENRMLVGVLSGTPNQGAKPAPITDREKSREALKASHEARAEDERHYMEGPVTFVQEIAVEYGHFEEYIDWLNSTWKPTMEATKKAGIIIDYKVFSATPQSPDRPSIILWITYENMAALDRGVEEEAIARKVICSTDCQNKARVGRNEYRKVLRRGYVRELILK